VALILPHESAEVSNTFSKRKAGFLYGFFAVVRALSLIEVFVAMRLSRSTCAETLNHLDQFTSAILRLLAGDVPNFARRA
jgi:hypothetical protein